MPPGLVERFQIIRSSWTDDIYGGAVETGTVIYNDIHGRLDYYTPRAQVREIGIETDKTYALIIRPPIDIRSEDVVVLTFPPHHPDYNNRFRVRGVQRQSMHPSDSRGFLDITLQRIETSRTNHTN